MFVWLVTGFSTGGPINEKFIFRQIQWDFLEIDSNFLEIVSWLIQYKTQLTSNISCKGSLFLETKSKTKTVFRSTRRYEQIHNTEITLSG